MTFAAVLAALDLLDSPTASGAEVAAALHAAGVDEVEVVPLRGESGGTDVVGAVVPGTHGRRAGADAPTLGIVGRLGGVGARPTHVGLVSDADGGVAVIACALKLGRMRRDPGHARLPGRPLKPHARCSSWDHLSTARC
jgi:Protein of unknown function (DUF1177)